MTMSADVPKPATTAAKRRQRDPLAIGDPVRVIAATYWSVRVGTAGHVGAIRPRRGKDDPELYELVEWPDRLFWRYELSLTPPSPVR